MLRRLERRKTRGDDQESQTRRGDPHSRQRSGGEDDGADGGGTDGEEQSYGVGSSNNFAVPEKLNNIMELVVGYLRNRRTPHPARARRPLLQSYAVEACVFFSAKTYRIK